MRSRELHRALTEAGGVVALARQLGLDASTVSGWDKLPAKHVGLVARLTGLPEHALRPDLFLEKPQPGFAETQTPFATEARALGLDPDAIAGKAIQDAIRAEKQRRWIAENQNAIAAWNDWTEANELPLEAHRAF
jgi:post-segregation antitoxin (ccd killing protein)